MKLNLKQTLTLLLLLVSFGILIWIMMPNEKQLAIYYEKDGDYAKALASYQKLYAKEGKTHYLYKIWLMSHKLNNSAKESKAFMMLAPKSRKKELIEIAEMERKDGHLDMAIRVWEKILRLHPQEERAYLKLGELYEWKKNEKKAFQVYQKGARNLPRSEPILTKLLLFYQKKKDDIELIKIYEKLVSLNPHKWTYSYELASLYIRTKQKKKGLSFLKKLKNRFLQQDKQFIIGKLFLALEAKREGFQVFFQLFEKGFEKAGLIQNLILTAEWMGDDKILLDVYQKLVHRHPKKIEYKVGASKIFLKQKKFEKVIHLLTPLLKESYDIKYKRHILELLRKAYLWNNQFWKGVSYLEEQIQLEPYNLKLRFRAVHLYQMVKILWRTLPHWKVILKKYPNNKKYLYAYFQALVAGGKIQKAISVLKNLVEREPKNPKYYRHLGKLYVSLFQLEKGRQNYEKAFLLSKEFDREAYDFLAYYFESRGRWKDLVLLLELALNKKDSADFHRLLAELYHRLGNLSKSFIHWEWLYKNNPKDSYLFSRLIETAKNLNKWKYVEDILLQKALQTKDPLLYWQLGKLFWQRKKKKKGFSYFEKAISLIPLDFQKRRELASLYDQEKAYGAEIIHLEFLYQHHQLSSKEIEYLAYLYGLGKREDKRIQLLQNLLQKGSLTFQGLEDLFYAYQDKKELSKALAVLERGISLFPGKKDELLLKKSEILEVQGKKEEAIQIYIHLYKKYPQNLKFLQKIALSLYERGQYSEAGFYFQRILEISPQNLIALYHLGILASWNNDWKRAVKYYQKYNRLKPKNYEVHFLLGELYFENALPLKGRKEHKKAFEVISSQKKKGLTKDQLSIYGRILFRLGRLGRSLAVYKKILKKYPSDQDTWADFLETLIMGKQYMAFLYYFKRLPTRIQSKLRFQRLLGRYYLEKENYEKAEAVLEKLERKGGKDLGILGDLGSIKSILGKWQEGLFYFGTILDIDTDNQSIFQERKELLESHLPQFQTTGGYQDDGISTILFQESRFSFAPLDHFRLYFGETSHLIRAKEFNPLVRFRKEYYSSFLGFFYQKEKKSYLQLEVRNIQKTWTSIRFFSRIQTLDERNQFSLFGKWQGLFESPLSGAGIEGKRDSLGSSLLHSLNKRMSIYLFGEYGKIKTPPFSGFSGYSQSEDWQITVEKRILFHENPLLSLALGFHHYEWKGKNAIGESLSLIQKSDALYLSLSYEKWIERHLLFSSFLILGTDPSRKVDIYYGGGGKILLRPYERWSFWVEGEAYSESQQGSSGSSFSVKGGLEILF